MRKYIVKTTNASQLASRLSQTDAELIVQIVGYEMTKGVIMLK